jgi:hypothetical protein
MLNTNYWKALSITTKWSLASIAIGAAAGLGQYLGLGRVELNPVFTGIIIAIISRNLGFLLQLMDTAKKQDEQL